MANDIAPELFDKISAEFERLYSGNAKIKTLLAKINAGTATYAEAEEYAELVGKICSASMLKYIEDDVLPDSRLYYNIAERTVRPMLEQSRNMAEEIAMSVQESLNRAAGLQLKAVEPNIDPGRIQGIINKVSDAEKFSETSWVLDAPVVNMVMNVVDETVKANAEFHSKSGMKAKIVRRQTAKCCEWCANLVGTYTYPEVPKDVYRRHENCRCVLTYVPEKGKVQDVWSKKEYTSEREAVEARIGKQEAAKNNEETYLKNKAIAKSNGDSFIDATEYWKNKPKDYPAYVSECKNAFSYNGKEYKIDGNKVVFSPSTEERETAELLANTFGGEIVLMPKVNYPKGIQVPDFIRNNDTKIDRKGITGSGKNVIDSAIKDKREQADHFVIDITNCPLDKKELRSQSEKIMNSKHREWVKQLTIVEKDKVLYILERI